MNKNFYIIILAGGSGTRLWPMSRCDRPKQFHNLCGPKSLIQETYDRIKDIVAEENIYVSLVENILKTSQNQLQGVPKQNYIVEPEGKNTAPALALVAIKLFKLNPDAIVTAISSDHTVGKISNFRKALQQAANFVKNNPEYLTTIGIEPTEPHTGYGYIKSGRKFSNTPALEVEKFVEKPDLKTARKYLESGEYLWNAGYFIFKASTLIEMYKIYSPEIYKLIKEIIQAKDNKNIEKIYLKMPKMPIDIAIAEKIKKIAVIPADLGWSDIGSWASLYEILSKKTKNQTVSKGHHIGINDKNCLIYAQDKLLATVGLEDIIIVDTADVTLVCHKDKSQEIKDLLEKIKKEGKDKYL